MEELFRFAVLRPVEPLSPEGHGAQPGRARGRQNCRTRRAAQ